MDNVDDIDIYKNEIDDLKEELKFLKEYEKLIKDSLKKVREMPEIDSLERRIGVLVNKHNELYESFENWKEVNELEDE